MTAAADRHLLFGLLALQNGLIDQGALETVCLKAMAAKPADRYANCRALAEDIERWAANEPGLAWEGTGADGEAMVDLGRSLTVAAGLLAATGKLGEALARNRRSESLLSGPAGKMSNRC